MSIQQMNGQENVGYTYNGILFSLKKEGNLAICNNMYERKGHRDM